MGRFLPTTRHSYVCLYLVITEGFFLRSRPKVAQPETPDPMDGFLGRPRGKGRDQNTSETSGADFQRRSRSLISLEAVLSKDGWPMVRAP